MKTRFKAIPIMLIAALLMAPVMATANTTNPSPASPGFMVLPIVFDRTVATASAPVIFRIKMPFAARVISVTASAETIDLTSGDETYTVDVLEAGTSILSSAISIAAQATVYQGTVSDAALADEAVVTGVLTAAGTTPSISTVTVLLVLKRL
ncbi:MAG: hypothetical protein M0036_04970 [Desulfobacteraceae bacterium]|nr:hypothetical protein [Desulfobacteraceae bacterium]